MSDPNQPFLDALWQNGMYAREMEKLRTDMDRVADHYLLKGITPDTLGKSYFTPAIIDLGPRSICTPVREGCKFLTMYTRYAVSGVPAGVRQHCAHPHHLRYRLLRLNFKEFIEHVTKLLTTYYRHQGLKEFQDIVIPAKSAERLVSECINELDQVCRTMLKRLNTNFELDKLDADNKEYTKIGETK